MGSELDVNRSIGGPFNNSENDSEARWEFEFNQSSQKTSLNVYKENSKELTTNLNKQDIKQLILWLSHITK